MTVMADAASVIRWDLRFLRMAVCEVATWSKDCGGGVGAVVVSPDRRQFTAGYNGFAAGVADTDERLNDPEVRDRLTIHAELNAILNARTNLTGWTLYTSKSPCIGCANAIRQVGVVRVVAPPIDHVSRWATDQWAARRILEEVGVAFSVYDWEEINAAE